jgi:hypothetical protein
MKSKKLISFDWAIKRILRNDNSAKLNKANFVVLEGFDNEFISDATDLSILEIENLRIENLS